jgi:tRNA-specific 2-thiouridylase
VRAAAAELGLSVADKPDSQDICFVPEGRYTTVIDRLRPHGAEPGDIVHLDGRVLGRHEGVTRYTIGQRRGLGVHGPAPLYVVRLDAGARQVVVGPRECLHTHWISLRDVNWLGHAPIPDAGLDVAARIRSSAPPQPATVYAHGSSAKVLLRNGEYGIAAGQACVFYADASPRARVLGGGWIERALSRSEQHAAPSVDAAAPAPINLQHN